MNVGKGHWIFAIVFFIVFIAGMTWAYNKDKIVDKNNYKGVYRIILYIFLVLILVYLFVKWKAG